jgi:hypothetical protein
MVCFLEVAEKIIFLRKYSTKYSTGEIWMMLGFGSPSSEF